MIAAGRLRPPRRRSRRSPRATPAGHYKDIGFLTRRHANARRGGSILPQGPVPSVLLGAVSCTARRMSERGTTGTLIRQTSPYYGHVAALTREYVSPSA